MLAVPARDRARGRGRRGRCGPGSRPAAGSRCGRRRPRRRSSATGRRSRAARRGTTSSRSPGRSRGTTRGPCPGARAPSSGGRRACREAFRRSSTSLMIGPWIVSRTVSVTSSPPATLIVSVRTVNGSGAVHGDVLRRVGRVHLLLDQVLDVRVHVGHAPGDPGVVPGDHPRGARERDAGDVERAGVRDRPAVEAVHVPDRGHVEAEVRVVGEQRAAATSCATGPRPSCWSRRRPCRRGRARARGRRCAGTESARPGERGPGRGVRGRAGAGPRIGAARATSRRRRGRRRSRGRR